MVSHNHIVRIVHNTHCITFAINIFRPKIETYLSSDVDVKDVKDTTAAFGDVGILDEKDVATEEIAVST